MKSAVFALLLALLANVAVAYKDLMMVCYARIPDGSDKNICGTTKRVLHALQGPDRQRHLTGGMPCGSYCAGWGDKNFCMEYMCDEDTRGEKCEKDDGTGLKGKALKHFKDLAKNKGPECAKMMESLECMCVDQAVTLEKPFDPSNTN